MKNLPNIALYVFGGICILQAISFLLFIESIVPYVFNTTPEGLEIAVLMHYAMAPLFLMMGLVAFFATTFDLESKRKVILAVIIGYVPLFLVFNYFMGLEVMNAGVETYILDIICFFLSLVAYLSSSKRSN
tara:strand:+ start:5123 stop:5515 length:393 start_codon:yes stop_codon:yes gene_type:complete